MDIMLALAAATRALELAKELIVIDSELSKADLKNRIISLTDDLSRTTEALRSSVNESENLKKQIINIQKKLLFNKNSIVKNGRLYETDDKGQPFGEPFCNLCYVKNDRLHQLRYFPDGTIFSGYYYCDSCEKYY